MTHYVDDIMDECLAERADDVQRLIDRELTALEDLIESCSGAEITFGQVGVKLLAIKPSFSCFVLKWTRFE